ncbi:hypothetical protein LJB91_02070 [Bacteroidales bacterium OttesenSCG-928-L03]|nr:hypothetical protein [Bacteroidales bacterium OttesenSCG-928-L03]
MKKISIIALFVFFTAGLFSFSSCNEDEEGNKVITVDGKAAIALTMDAKGDSQTVTVWGAQEWVAEATEWITIDTKSGEANKKTNVKITVEANDGEERLGSVVFTLPNEEFALVSVVQPQATSN